MTPQCVESTWNIIIASKSNMVGTNTVEVSGRLRQVMESWPTYIDDRNTFIHQPGAGVCNTKYKLV